MKGTTKVSKKKPGVDMAKIRAKLGHLTHDVSPRVWLDTGDRYLNSVIGEEEKGIAFGKILEVAGPPSNGKTALALDIAAVGQANYRAFVVWADFENSFDQPKTADQGSWYQRRGVECHEGSENFALVQPYVGLFGTSKVPRLTTAEELLTEVELVISTVHQAEPERPMVVVVDSVTAMLPEDQAVAGVGGQNMRTTMALPVLLGDLLRRWIGFLPESNALGVFINQLRTKPGMAFGDPDYTPGGNALPFYAHSRVRLRRVKGGKILRKGRMIGVKGVLVNKKNKAGGIEGEECGFRIFFDGRSKFSTVEDVKGEA